MNYTMDGTYFNHEYDRHGVHNREGGRYNQEEHSNPYHNGYRTREHFSRANDFSGRNHYRYHADQDKPLWNPFSSTYFNGYPPIIQRYSSKNYGLYDQSSSRRRRRYRSRQRQRSYSSDRSRGYRRRRRRERSTRRKRERERRRRHRDTTDGESSDDSVDDTQDHHRARKGDTLNGRFVIEKEIGMGTFGKVVRCMDTHDGKNVAIKIVRNVKRYCESAKIEADILYDINVDSRGREFCSQILSRFDDHGHYCIVLEELGQSLYDYIKANSYKGFPIDIVQSISRQLMNCMSFLKEINLIHTDLKPENILVCPGEDTTVDHNGASLKVPKTPKIKVIDFGGATYDDEHKSSIINTRQYRGPEVILGCGWTFPSDMWSCGCIIAEVYSGELYFGTHANNEHLALMNKVQGPFPCHMLDTREASKYFDSKGRIRTDEFSKSNYKRIDAMIHITELVQKDSSSGLGDLLNGLLSIDPDLRLTPEQALSLPFLASANSLM